MIRTKILLIFLLAYFVEVIPQNCVAQMFGYGKNSGSSPNVTLVEESRALDSAKESFRYLAGKEVKSVCQKLEKRVDSICPRLEQAAKDIQKDFNASTEDCIYQLMGDGVLDAAELGDKLGELHDDYLAELKEALKAIRKGYSPPPVIRDFADSTEFAFELTRYTFLKRNSLLDWLYLSLAIMGALIVAKTVNYLICRGREKLNKSRHPWSVHLLSSLRGPLYVTAVSLSIYTGLTWLWIPGIAEDFITKSIWVILTLAGFWFLWNVSRSIGSVIAWTIEKTYNREVDQHVAVIIRRIVRVAVVMSFFLIVIHVILDSSLTGLIAGLGVVGLALSFILKGTLENVMASFTIFGDKPFRTGDMIIFDEEWGTIEDIGFRSTKFRTLDGHLYTIPNLKLIDDSIRNVGARPYIRRRFRIGLTFGTPPDKIQEAIDILQDVLKNHEGQPDDRPPHVEFESYGTYELRILVQYYYQPPDYWQALALDSKINIEILKRFNEAGIEIAFPTETHIMTSDQTNAPQFCLVDSNKEEEEPSKKEKKKSSSEKNKSPSRSGGFEEQNQEETESGESGQNKD